VDREVGARSGEDHFCESSGGRIAVWPCSRNGGSSYHSRSFHFLVTMR
jgi:hypothetical protein